MSGSAKVDNLNCDLLDGRDESAFALLAGRSSGQTLIGGTGTTDVLKLQGTSANGTATSPAVQLLVGNNGATVSQTVLNNGNTGLLTANPQDALAVDGNMQAVGGNTNTGYDRYLKLYGNTDPASNPHRWAGVAVYNNGGNNVNELGFFTGTGDVARTDKFHIDNQGRSGFLTIVPTAAVDINSDTLRLRTSATPASATASGNAGDIQWDASYVYVCIATNTWRRAAIAVW